MLLIMMSYLFGFGFFMFLLVVYIWTWCNHTIKYLICNQTTEHSVTKLALFKPFFFTSDTLNIYTHKEQSYWISKPHTQEQKSGRCLKWRSEHRLQSDYLSYQSRIFFEHFKGGGGTCALSKLWLDSNQQTFIRLK
jgi:hypothetical protein